MNKSCHLNLNLNLNLNSVLHSLFYLPFDPALARYPTQTSPRQSNYHSGVAGCAGLCLGERLGRSLARASGHPRCLLCLDWPCSPSHSRMFPSSPSPASCIGPTFRSSPEPVRRSSARCDPFGSASSECFLHSATGLMPLRRVRDPASAPGAEAGRFLSATRRCSASGGWARRRSPYGLAAPRRTSC
jgi:hypothetical protein